MSRYSDQVIADGGADLLGYWPLDAEWGTADKSGAGNTATAGGGATVGGTSGPGMLTASLLDGVDDRFSPLAQLWPKGAGATRTVEFWAYRNTHSTIDMIVAESTFVPYIALLAGGQTIEIVVSADGHAVNYTWPGDSQWVHGLWVANDSTQDQKLYLNGVSQGTKNIARAWSWTGTAGVILGANTASSNPFDGRLCHVAIYNGDKSSLAASHYALGLTYFDSGSGAAALAGSGTEGLSFADAISGAVALSGSGSDSFTEPAVQFEPDFGFTLIGDGTWFDLTETDTEFTTTERAAALALTGSDTGFSPERGDVGFQLTG